MKVLTIKQITVGYHPRREISGKDELKRSIEKDGLREPVTVRRDGNGYVLIDGLRRLQAIQELGWTEVPCIALDANEKEAAHLSWSRNTEEYRKNLNPMEEAYHLQAMQDRFGYSVKELVELGYASHHQTIYNKLSLLSLPESVQQEVSAGRILPSAGYQLAKLNDQPEVQAKLAEEDISRRRLSTRNIKHKVREIRQAQKRQEENPALDIPKGEIPGVFFKDSRDMSELADSSVHLVLTSPPYYVGLEYEKDLSFEEHQAMLQAVFAECARVLVPGGVVFLNFGDIHNYGSRNGGAPEVLPMGGFYNDLLRKHGLRLTDTLIWEKNLNWDSCQQVMYSGRCPHTSYRTLNNSEYLWVFRKDGKREVPLDLEYESRLTKEEWKELVPGVWKIRSVPSQDKHPAQFPEALVERAVRMFSYKGDVVLDPFLGSGTTVKVARALGRNGIGYERMEKYKPVIMEKLGIESPETRPFSAAPEQSKASSPVDDVVNRVNDLVKALRQKGRDTRKIQAITIPYSSLDHRPAEPIAVWHDDEDDGGRENASCELHWHADSVVGGC